MATPQIKTRSVAVTVSATASYTTPIRTNLHVTGFNVGFVVNAGGGTHSVFTVEHTYDDIWDMTDPNTSADWYPHSTVVSVSGANAEGAYTSPISAYRLAVSANPSATTIELTGIQAGVAD